MPPPPLTPGQRLPDLVLANSAGEEAALSGMRGEAMLLIFLRHLG